MNDSTQLSRRAFLTGLAGAGLAATPLRTLGEARTMEQAARPRFSPEAFKQRVLGPILTVPTPFTRDFAVDYNGVRNMVNLGLANGVGVYELTAGNSQYAMLSYDEIKQLTRVLVEVVGGRGVVIATTGPWWTGQAVDYARYAEQVGADALQVLLPGGSEDGYVTHFRKLAEATRLPLVLQGDPRPALIERLIEIPAIVSMKEDGSDAYYVDIQKRFGKRLAIFCGGQKRRYLLAQPYGSPAFFSFFITFAPEVTVRFWQAVQKNDLEEARGIVAHYEKPVFDLCLAGPRSFPAYWRAFLEVFGVAQRYVRPPEESCTEEDMQKVRALCDRLGLVPKARA
ncbi:MAG TPA: dihydrodipicolinate synthase family protein [Chthonomonadaceae bacterium]|nr:dihydrodipicolinate synthase family protein [Chthonomonadaceae bacterium]